MAFKHYRALLLAAITLAILVSLLNFGARDNPGRLVYKSSALGVVWAQDRFSQRVMLCNQTSQPLEISHFSTSCACTSVTPANIRISPNSSAPIDLLINTTDGHPFEIESLAYKSVSIRPKLADGTYLETYELSTAIKSPFAVDLKKLRFKEPLITGHRSKNLEATLILCPDISMLEAMNVDPRITVVCTQVNKTTCKLDVRFNGNSPPAQLSAPVGIRPTTNEGEHLPPLSLHVIGYVVTDLILKPEVLYLENGQRLSPTSEDSNTIQFTVASRSGARVNGLQMKTNSKPECLGGRVFTGLGTSKVSVQAELRRNCMEARSVTISVEAQVEGQKINPNLELPVIAI